MVWPSYSGGRDGLSWHERSSAGKPKQAKATHQSGKKVAGFHWIWILPVSFVLLQPLNFEWMHVEKWSLAFRPVAQSFETTDPFGEAAPIRIAVIRVAPFRGANGTNHR